MSGKDEMEYAFDPATLQEKLAYFDTIFSKVRKYSGHPNLPTQIKWSRNLIRKIGRELSGEMPAEFPSAGLFRPFVTNSIARSDVAVDELGAAKVAFAGPNRAIAFLCVSSANPLAVLASDRPVDYGLLEQGNGGTQAVFRYRYSSAGECLDNITDWALEQFQKHYGSKGQSATNSKDGIFIIAMPYCTTRSIARNIR